MPKKRIFLYGQSMLLSFVANNLAQCPNLSVTHESEWDGIMSQVATGTPDVLIYDPDSSSESAILPLLYENPNLLLIGLDVEANRAVLIAGKETTSLTLERIRQIIETAALDE